MEIIEKIYEYYQVDSLAGDINYGEYSGDEFEGTFFGRSLIGLEPEEGFFEIEGNVNKAAWVASRSLPAFFMSLTMFVMQVIEVLALLIASAFIVLGESVAFFCQIQDDQSIKEFKLGLHLYGSMLGAATKAILTESIEPLRKVHRENIDH